MVRAELLETLGLSHCKEQVALAPKLVNTDEAFDHQLTAAEVESLYVYDQPSGLGMLNLAPWLGLAWSQAALGQPTCKPTQRLWRLGRVVERLSAALGPGADWVGIYRAVHEHDGTRCLLKEAYRGSTSRGLFPLTEDFAAGSNNSSCAMSRRAKVVKDTLALKADEPYYE
mmetsp:Transcript_50489/g.94336  ORF Transcript_50489/g.94336 Transcript_50489/m.94336 type:complete len:171 (-) Transcript_50489:128-640(-)